jgi:hypothetical protein
MNSLLAISLAAGLYGSISLMKSTSRSFEGSTDLIDACIFSIVSWSGSHAGLNVRLPLAMWERCCGADIAIIGISAV